MKDKENKYKKLMNNTVLFMIGNLGSKFIQFFLVPLYTYTLTTIEYGTVDYVFTTINFLIPIFSIQISDALLRYGLDRAYNKEKIINATFKIIYVGSLISLIISPIAFLNNTLKPWVAYFIILLNLQIYRDLLSIILKIQEKNKQYAINSIVYTFTLCIISIITLKILNLGIRGYFWSYIIANIISIFYLLMQIKLKFHVFVGKTDYYIVKILSKYSIPLIINSLAYWITTASDRYMINYIKGVEYLGIYAVACKIPTIITTITGIFNQAWMISSISEYENENNGEFYKNVFEIYYGTSLIICSFAITFIKPFFRIYVNESYFIAWYSSGVLILSSIYSGVCAFINGIFYAYKKNISITITTLIGAFINILMNFVLIPKYGITGAAMATSFSWLVIMIFRIISVKNISSMEVDAFKIFATSIIIILELLVLKLFDNIYGYLINLSFIIIIMYIEKNVVVLLFKIALNKCKGISKLLREKTRVKKDKKDRENLINHDFSIISSNCIGGVIYHNLNMKFLTPTINLYFSAKDFIKFCENIEYYLSCNIEEIKSKDEYPIIKLGDLVMYGIHYKDYGEFEKKWNERRKRVNLSNCFIMMTERDGCTYEDLLRFDKLNFKNKVVFTHRDYPDIDSAYYIKGTENKNDIINKTKALTDYKYKIFGKRYIDDFDYVKWFNSGRIE